MRIGVLIAAVLLFGHFARSQQPAEAAGKKTIRVLIVDGFSNHDWKQTTWMVRHILEWLATGRVTYPVPPNFPTAGGTSLRAEADMPGMR